MSKGTFFERSTNRGARCTFRMLIFVQSEGVASAISLQDLETESRVNGALSPGTSDSHDARSASTVNSKMVEIISGGK